MPNILTHCWYADLTATRLFNDRLKNIIRKNRHVFMLGAQGADFFTFYKRMTPAKRRDTESVRQCGDLLHDDKINESFRILFENCRNSEILIAYVCGYICHWALDKTAHPYVFYETGSKTEMAGALHAAFESEIDYRIIYDNKIDTDYYNVGRFIKVSSREKPLISSLMRKVLTECYEADITERQISDSIRDFCLVQQILWDPKHKKRAFIKKIDAKLNLNGLAIGLVLPESYDETMDAINEERRIWKNPADERMTANETFYELGLKAIASGIELIELFGSFLDNKIEVNDLLKYINDESFFSGLDYRKEMKYFRKDETAH